MFIVGERINCTRKPIAEAVERQDAQFIKGEALKQVEAGAQVLDVNGGVPGREQECLPWLVKTVQEATDAPLCLDSADPEALRLALPLCKQRPMINSITDEPKRYEAVLPLVKQSNTKIVALCMTTSGPPTGVADRLATASRLVERLTAAGVALDDIYIDPCLLPVATGPEHGRAALEAMAGIRKAHPSVHLICGLSNVSFGLPLRKLLNEVFLTMAIAAGLDSAVLDPCDRRMMVSVAAAEALLGVDEYCAAYIRAYRQGRLALS